MRGCTLGHADISGAVLVGATLNWANLVGVQETLTA